MADEGVPCVLVHGVRTTRTMWRAQVEALTRSGVRVLAIDLPGHGERAGERFTLEGAVEAVAQAADAVGGRALVVGLSLGGYVAVRHAARHPAQVAGLVLSSCSTRPWGAVVGAWAAGARVLERLPDRGAALNAWAVRKALPAAGAVDVAAGGFTLDVMPDVLAEVRASTPLEDLGAVTAPVWLVNGRWDHFRGEERRFLAACQDGRLVVLPGATHLVSLVRPVAYTRVLLDVLHEVEQREADARR